tara:strand:+ start:49 stop:369 length:321 start_codon:yes stop_codon:yes gene_type:complete
MTPEPPKSILDRALKFAMTFAWVNPVVRSSAPASSGDVSRYGTLGHTEYWDFKIILEWPAERRASMLETSLDVERRELERFIDAGVNLRIVCSATDIVYHEFPDID